uniref:DNA-directed RNA polymerase I subunit D n=1 Tax=Globodera rostochiensis TaxID=31243 RepID=A0A914I223_GLORO
MILCKKKRFTHCLMEEEISGRCTAGRIRLPPTVAPQKVELLNAEEYKADKTMITVILYEEDHTVGNALKHIICQMPGVEFCGYNVPHPLEDKILVRIQTVDGVVAGDVLLRGLEDLAQIFGTIERKFKSAHRKHFGGTAQDNDDDA